MNTARALLDIEVFVSCPKCDFYIDLLTPADTSGYDHNEEGHIITQACGDGWWMGLHKKFEVDDVTCTECETTFNVKGMEW